MIEATTIDEIEQDIRKGKGGEYISLLLICRYRKDRRSVPWRVAINAMSYHESSGEYLKIYVPGFSFYGKSEKPDIGTAIEIKNSSPLGYYYPAALAHAENHLRQKVRGLEAGASVSLVAFQVADNVPDWTNSVVMDLSDNAETADRRFMEAIHAYKASAGLIEPTIGRVGTRLRIDRFITYLTQNGWSIISAVSGIVALLAKK